MMMFDHLYIFLNLLLMMIMVFPSNLFKFHPLTLNLLLILYTILICFSMNFLKNIFWYSYILFLIMVGGLMILFMYFTSLASNQLFYFKMNLNMYLFMKLIYLLIIFIFLENKIDWILSLMMVMNNLEMLNLNFINLKYEKFLYLDLLKDFCLGINIFLVMYLFMMMICMVLVCLKVNIPLRQLIKIYEKIIL